MMSMAVVYSVLRPVTESMSSQSVASGGLDLGGVSLSLGLHGR